MIQNTEEDKIQDLIPVNPVEGVIYDHKVRARLAWEELLQSKLHPREGYSVIRNPLHPILHQKCKKIKNTQDFSVTEMTKTLVYHHLLEQGLGLAANQIGWNAQACAIAVLDSLGRPTNQTIVLYNPRIVGTTDMTNDNIVEGVEGCLSHPGVWCNVWRLRHFRFIASTPTHPKEKTYDTREVMPQASELFARVLQHEIQHLQGKLMNDPANQFQYVKIDPEGQKILVEENQKAAEFGLQETE